MLKTSGSESLEDFSLGKLPKNQNEAKNGASAVALIATPLKIQIFLRPICVAMHSIREKKWLQYFEHDA